MWCVGDLGLACERVNAGFTYGVVETPEFLAVNPNGTVPVLQDGVDPPMWDAGAILRYIAILSIFSAQALVSWSHTLAVLADSAAGGFLGGKLVRTAWSRHLRAVVIAVGVTTTIVHAWRYGSI